MQRPWGGTVKDMGSCVGWGGEVSLERKQGSQPHRQGKARSFHLELQEKQCGQIPGNHLRFPGTH